MKNKRALYKVRTRAFAGALAVLLTASTLAGCSSEKNVSGGVRLDNGDINSNSIVIRVGDEGVKYSEVQNYCYLLKKQYEGSFGKKLWKYDLGNSQTVGDEAKEEIINMVTQLKVICSNAKEQDISLTNDERDEALKLAEKLVSSATDKEKKTFCLTQQNLSLLYEENLLANKMFYIATDAADTEVSDSEAQQIKIQFFQIITNGTQKNGLEVHLDSEEKKKAKERAEQMRQDAVKAADFLAYARNHTEGSLYELTLGRDCTEIDKGAVNAAFKLKKDAVSKVVETETGYYVIRCVTPYDEDATYAKKEAIIEERQTAMFKEKYTQWLGDSEVSISKSFWRIFEL